MKKTFSQFITLWTSNNTAGRLEGKYVQRWQSSDTNHQDQDATEKKESTPSEEGCPSSPGPSPTPLGCRLRRGHRHAGTVSRGQTWGQWSEEASREPGATLVPAFSPPWLCMPQLGRRGGIISNTNRGTWWCPRSHHALHHS